MSLCAYLSKVVPVDWVLCELKNLTGQTTLTLWKKPILAVQEPGPILQIAFFYYSNKQLTIVQVYIWYII